MMTWHLGILVSHPIQYFSPWFCYLAERLDLEVFYAHRQDAGGQAEAGFGVEFDWDIPLLEGYQYRWLANVARNHSVGSFRGCDTPEVYDLLRNEKFDAFLVFGWNYKSAIQTIRACWRNNVPVLMRSDSQLRSQRWWVKSIMKYFPYCWFLSLVDAHLYVGIRNKKYLRYYGVSNEQLFFAPHFVDNDFFTSRAREAVAAGKHRTIRNQLNIPYDAFVVLFVGKFIQKKRPADFIHACLQVFESPEGANIHAILVGDGPLRESLQILAVNYAKRIHFAGFQNQLQIPPFYTASNVLVLPSDGGETWGLAVNEAMACGIPAIVSDAVGCGPDLIDESRTGFTFALGNVKALARCILMMREMCRCYPLEIRQALVEKLACYSIEVATDGLLTALDVVTKRSRSRD